MSGIFPDNFIVAVISPIHNSGDKTECNYFRAISVIFFSVFAKVFEKLISNQLFVHLETNGMLTKQ